MGLFVTQFGVPESNLQVALPSTSINIYQPYLYILVDVFGLVFLFIILMYLIRALLRSRSFLPHKFEKVIYLVTIPKESSDAADEQEHIDKIRAQIALAESWFSTLGGLKAQSGFKSWLYGRTDVFSLELVVQKSIISFYVTTPRYLQDFMEQQILAQYPEANMTQVEDYNIFSPTSQVLSGYLKMTRSFMFPIKTYRSLNSDPLNAITNSLSSIDPVDSLAIQIIARPSSRGWHKQGTRVASAMQRGKTLNQAMATTKVFSLSGFVNFFSTKTPSQIEQGKNSSGVHSLSPMEQELIRGLEEKTSRAGFDCNVRIVVAAKDKLIGQRYLDNIVDSFTQFNFYQYGNSFKVFKSSPQKLVDDFIYRKFKEGHKMILNTEEMASIYHLPTPFLDTPNINWLLSKKLPPATNLPQDGLLVGENIYRGKKTNVYLDTDDRRRHAYVIGMTGTGKSVLMANMAIQDIRSGKGVCVIDPHGSLVEDILPAIPKERLDDVIYFNPADVDRPIGLNMLEANTPEEEDFAVQEMISIFYKLVADPSMIGPMFEHNMRNAMLTLMADKENPGTIAEIPRIFTDREFQEYKVSKVKDPMVRSFWEQEMAKTSDFHKSEMLGYIISKVGRFIENAMVRNIIGQPKSGFNFRDVMDNQKILLVNLSKGQTGEVNSNLLGLIIVAKLQMAALSRTNMPEDQRKDFYLYIDEFQNFITDSISTILAEARKYKLNLILAHQYLGQLSGGSEGKNHGSKIRDAIFGNVGTMMSFRIGNDDTEAMAKQFAPSVDEYDLMNIDKFNAYIRPLVNNQPLKPFNIKTFPLVTGDPKMVNDIVEFSRWKYGKNRSEVEKNILDQAQLGVAQKQAPVMPTERST